MACSHLCTCKLVHDNLFSPTAITFIQLNILIRKGALIDLSKDKEASIDASGLSPFQAAVERVIQKVFTHYAIPLSISDPIRMTFRSKLWRMGKCLSTIGGGNKGYDIAESE